MSYESTQRFLIETNHRLQQHGIPCFSMNVQENGSVCLDREGMDNFKLTISKLLDLFDRKVWISGKATESLDNEIQLKAQLTELQYANSRLKVELVNRPDPEELHQCQERARCLEKELLQYKSSVKSRIADVFSTGKILEDAGVLLNVDSIDAIIPEVISLQDRVQQFDQIQQNIADLLNSILGPSYSEMPLFVDQLSDQTWESAKNAVEQMKQITDSIKPLQDSIKELYGTLEKDKMCSSRQNVFNPRHPRPSCREMADIINEWTKCKKHRKCVQHGALQAMVQHFQQLFEVQSLDGVFPAMNKAYSSLQEARTAKKYICHLLGDRTGRSWESIVGVIQKLVSSNDGRFLLKVQKSCPDLTSTQILQQLQNAQLFFPTFLELVKELQILLGVQSLGAIVPAVRRLRLKLHEHK